MYVSQKPGTDEGVDIFQKNAKEDEGYVQVELYDAENHPDYCFERVEAIIRDLVDTKDYQYSDIALLVRRSEVGSAIANDLNAKGIPVISQDSILLKSSDKVQLIVNTLRYLLNGDNETVIANVLFYWKLVQEPGFEGDVSPLFGEVKAIAKGEKAIEPVMGLGKAGLLQDALAKATCLYDLCANLLRIFHFDTIHDAFLNYFMEEVLKSQFGIKEGIADFLTYWDTKQGKLAVMSVGGNAVRIMTIHKSKGLEFPVVIYPEAITDLDERLNNTSVEMWLHPEELGFDAICDLDKVLFKLGEKAGNMGKEAEEKVKEEKGSNRLDNLNLLYVAFTRAIQRLYVIASDKMEGKESKKKKDYEEKTHVFEKFLAETQWDEGFAPEIELGSMAKIYSFGDPGFMKPKKKIEEEKKALKTESVAGDWYGKITVDANPTLVWQSKSDKLQPREWGELVHQILAKICTADDMERVLSPYLAEGTINEETACWIRERFKQMTRNELIAAAFHPSAKVKTECEIYYPQSETGVVRLDRYAELPDVIYLIDYKTGQKNNKHIEQVQEYATALKELSNKEIRAYLVYLSEAVIEVKQVVC